MGHWRSGVSCSHRGCNSKRVRRRFEDACIWLAQQLDNAAEWLFREAWALYGELTLTTGELILNAHWYRRGDTLTPTMNTDVLIIILRTRKNKPGHYKVAYKYH